MMAIDYYAVAERNLEFITRVLDGDDRAELVPFDSSALVERIRCELPMFQPFAKDFAEIAKGMNISEEQARARFGSVELNWAEDNYIQIEVSNALVRLSHGFGGGDLQLQVLGRLVALFMDQGLWVWDPQNRRWLD
jgi:hypothetical protein